MSNLTQRLLTAAVGLPLILLVLYLGGIFFLLFIIAIMIISTIEYFGIIGESKFRPNKILIIIGCIAIGLGAYTCSFIMMLLFTAAVMIFMILQLRSEDFSDSIKKAGMAIFPLVYLGWFLSHGILLRNISYDTAVLEYSKDTLGLQNPGFFFMVIVFACTFLNDTGAYFTGKNLGKRKLSPSISPGKTVEGTIGGLVISVIAAYVFNLIFSSPLTMGWVLIYGVSIGVASIFGDLVESSIKRGGGVKDSGGIVPGHGGVLDRFDSFFLVFPVAYYLTVFFYYSKGLSFY